MNDKDTIIAPATAPGEGGIAILRLSGPRAEEYLLRRFQPSKKVSRLQSHHLYHGRILSSAGDFLDEVMAVIMRQPKSYTRENVAEVHCHGGPQVTRRLLDQFIEDGVRLARPGEFTLRAFLNGRLDLTQAEAVIDVIRSASDASCRIALGQLEGKLSSVLRQIRDKTLDILALVETHVDFPEEDILPPDLSRLREGVNSLLKELNRLLASFDAGRTLREGMAVLILGKPNVGKSSLLNGLLGEARAIVTSVPGTTRDTIEESFSLGGIPLRLVDSAGIRKTCDPVEEEGIRRAREKISSADLILLVLDGSCPIDSTDRLALELSRSARVLLVLNKSDRGTAPLPPDFEKYPRVSVSVLTGAGMEELREKMTELFLSKSEQQHPESILLSDRRHREALVRGQDSLQRFILGLEGDLSPEFLALEIREALQAIGEVTGETTPDEVLDRIFSRFCIGK